MNFSASHPEGISYEFGTFLHKALEGFVSPCRSIKKLQNWYAQQVPMKSSKWRDSWRNAWKKKRKQRRKARKDTEAAHAVATLTTCKTKRRLHVQSPLVYSAKGKNSTLSVPLPDFKQLRNSKGRSRAVQAIRFYARENTGSRNKPCCYMLVPAGLTPGKKRSAEYSLGQEFGANKTYLQFFKEHVAYAVGGFTRFRQLYAWCNNNRKSFINLVQQLWKLHHQMVMNNRAAPDLVWRIDRSLLDPDMTYIKEKMFRDLPDCGMGLFATRKNKTTFYFDGPPDVTERFSLKEKTPTKMQGHYFAGCPGSDEVVVCTKESLRVRAIHHTYIINHSSDNPTHEFDYCHAQNKPCLVPRRDAEEGEEYTFCYNMLREGAKDVETEPTPPPSDNEGDGDESDFSEVEGEDEVEGESQPVQPQVQPDLNPKVDV